MTETRSLVAVVWATVVWMALWGSLSLANLLAGVAVGVLTVWLVPVASDRPDREEAGLTVRPIAALAFIGYFLRLLVVASAIVAWEVVTPQNRIHQGIIRVPVRTDSPGLATVLANAISLTPGTVTLEVARDPMVLYVHVLHLRAVEDVRADLRRLEERAMRAFHPAALETPVPTVPDQEAAP